MRKGYSIILKAFCFVVMGVFSFSCIAGEQNLSKMPFVPGVAMAGDEIPPAPPFAAPTLRADQIWQLEREKAATQPGTEDLTSVRTEEDESTTTAKLKPTRQDTGLRISRTLDPKSRRMVEAEAGQVLVRFRLDGQETEVSQALSRHETTMVGRKTDALEKIGYHRVSVPGGVSVDTFLADLSAEAAIEYAEPNIILRSNGEKPDDPVFGPAWGLETIQAPQAWQVTQGDPSIIVAVVDSGISAGHSDLSECLVPGYNFIADDSDTLDDYGHGTQVAGIIAARYNQESGTSGVAPLSRLMPLKVLDANGEGTVADTAEAIVFAADSGTRVITLALGTYAESDVLRAAVEYAAKRNVLIIAAGGNNGTDEPAYPAAYPQTLAVGAVDQFRKPCLFSNRGSYIDVVAPGKDILTTNFDGGYQELTGTSAAAAYLSGLAALVLAVEPALGPDALQGIIRSSAVDLQRSGWDAETGFGLVDAFAALNQTPTALVDLGIVDIMVLPQRPRPEQAANIHLTIRNHGLETVEDAQVVLKRDGQVVASLKLQELGPKETRGVTLPWTPSLEDAETSVSLTAELAPLAGETATIDNTRLVEVAVTHEDERNLAILQARALGMPLTPGASFTVETTLANLGNIPERQVVLTSQGLQSSTTSVISLDPGERRTVNTEWTLPDDSPGPDEVIPVYALVFSIEPVESENTADNTLVLKLSLNREHGQMVAFHLTGDSYSDNAYVHQWIAQEAYNYFVSQVEGSELGTYLGTISGSFITANSDLLEGTFAEDRSNRDPLFQGSGDPDPLDGPFMRHFCKGADGSELEYGLFWDIYDSAYEQGILIWDDYAKPDYPGNKPRAYYRFGHVVHLLSDMTVPAHVHNDEHPLSEPYEDSIGANEWFKLWYFGCTRSSLGSVWEYPLSVDYSDLRSIFYTTANYTEDYDSEDASGDVSKGSSPYYPADYPTTWHRPGEVSRDGGMSSTELTITGDDLMPYAIRRMADLYRLWYKEVDSSAPLVDLTYPTSEDAGDPTIHNTLSAFDLTASAGDGESGILKNGYQFVWAYWTGSAWSGWSAVAPSPTTNSVSFTPTQGETLYAFRVLAENGGGHQAWSDAKYMRVFIPTRIINLSGDMAFGEVTVGQSGQRTLTISNTGNSTLTVGSISFPSGFSGDWAGGSVAAGGSQEVTVTFSPSSATTYGGTITVNSDHTSGANTTSCSGTGVIPATRIISLSGDMDFGEVTVGQSGQRTLTISNDGNSTLTVSSISFPSGFSGDWAGGSVAAGGSQDVTVTFSPTEAASYGGTITVNSDHTSGTNTVSCSGTGVIPATRIISLSGDMDFGEVTIGQSGQRTLTISNDGNSTLTVSSISFPSGFSGDWTSGSVAAGGSQEVTVTFSPTEAATYDGTITVNSDHTSGTNTASCSGTGVAESCSLGDAVDAPGLTMTTGGHADWFCQTSQTQDTVDAAQSGLITHGQQTWMQVIVTGPGTISFWWKVSSETSGDFLGFSIGGLEQDSISGDVDWEQQSFPVPAGEQVLEWTYAKNSSLDGGDDAGYVDQVVWVTEPLTYMVSYDANQATRGDVPDSQTKEYDEPLTLRTNTGHLARTGYTFAGWNTNANGTGTDYAAGGTYTDNASVTLYAKWAKVGLPWLPLLLFDDSAGDGLFEG